MRRKQATKLISRHCRGSLLHHPEINTAGNALCSSSRLTSLWRAQPKARPGARPRSTARSHGQKHGGAERKNIGNITGTSPAHHKCQPTNCLHTSPPLMTNSVQKRGKGASQRHCLSPPTQDSPLPPGADSGFSSQVQAYESAVQSPTIRSTYHKQAQHMRATAPLPSEITRALHHQYNAKPPRRKERTKKERGRSRVRRKGGADAPGIPEQGLTAYIIHPFGPSHPYMHHSTHRIAPLTHYI